jgi:hypothetical protein
MEDKAQGADVPAAGRAGAGREGGVEGHKPGCGCDAHAAELPPLDFTTFLFSLSTSVLMNLGVVENPITKKTEKEPAAAKQTIDLIELLKDKTRGNLTAEEARLMDDVLRELRLMYCKAAG